MSSTALARVQAWRFGSDLRACFEAATAGGASLEGMADVAGVLVASSATSVAATALVQASLRFALSEMAGITQATTFASRDDVDRALALVSATFAPAQEWAADHDDAENYRTLVTLQAVVVRDLTARGRQLPRVVPFKMTGSVPSFVLAQRLYGDATRADELVAENKVRHPLFMPRAGRALAV